jgi:hypothetical protein
VQVVHEDTPGRLKSWYYCDAVVITLPAAG